MSDFHNWCPTCGKRPNDPEALFCSNSFHLSRPTPEPQAEAVDEPICYGMRQKGSTSIIGIIPPKVHATPATAKWYLENYEEVPLYTRPQPGEGVPAPLRKYIHDLHTNCDPAGMVRENVLLREQVQALSKLVKDDD